MTQRIKRNGREARRQKTGGFRVKPARRVGSIQFPPALRLTQEVEQICVSRGTWVGELIVTLILRGISHRSNYRPGLRRRNVIRRHDRERQAGDVGETELHGGRCTRAVEVRRAGCDVYRRDCRKPNHRDAGIIRRAGQNGIGVGGGHGPGGEIGAPNKEDHSNELANPSESQKLSVTPNPFDNFLNISYSGQPLSKVRIEIYNADGKLVKLICDCTSDTEGKVSIRTETENLSPGNYTIRAVENGKTSAEKVILCE